MNTSHQQAVARTRADDTETKNITTLVWL